MKLIFLIDLLKDYRGGTFSVYKFAVHLTKMGHSVYIFYSNNSELISKAQKSGRITVYRRYFFPRLQHGGIFLNRLLISIYDAFDLIPFVNSNKNKIDYILGYQTDTAIRAYLIGKKFGINVANFVFETPDWLSHQWGKEWDRIYRNSSVKMKWEHFKIALLESKVIFSNSNMTHKALSEWLGSEISYIIYPGVDAEVMPEYKVRDKKYIIFIGRLSRNKNVDLIIKALQLVNNPPPLIICGTGPEMSKIKKLATETKVKSIFMGNVSEDKKWNLMAISRFMVFPSSFEGFGMPPMEALACGVPCICSDLSVFKEVYADKVEYFEEHNVEQLAKKIRFMLEHPEYCERRGKEGQEYVRKKFSWQKSAKKIEEILKENLNEKNN